MRDLEQFFANRAAARESWLALLAGILAIGYDIPIIPLPDGTLGASRERLYQLTCVAQRMAFTAATQTHRPPLSSFQALLAVILAKKLHFEWIDGNNGLSGLLGLAQRLVFTMGLHRDPRLAQNAFEAEDRLLREKVFSTYLILEYQQSLETGIPFLLRPADFDVRNPGGPDSLKDKHLADFMKVFPTLAKGLHITHSANTKVRQDEVAAILQALSTSDKPATARTKVKPAEVIEQLVTSFVPNTVNRLHVALLDILLEQGTADIRQRLTTDMYKPAFALIDQYIDTMKSVETIVQPDVREALQKVVYMCMRTSMFNAACYVMVFLKLSLSDSSLLSLRGPASAALDSSFVFRKLRSVAEYSACGFTWSFQVIKETAGFNAHLNAVQALYRIYVETGEGDPDLLSEDGQKIIAAMAKGLEDTYERAGMTIGPGDEPTVDLPPSLTASRGSNSNSPNDFFKHMDPLLFENWDWPWTDLVGDADTMWSTPGKQSWPDAA